MREKNSQRSHVCVRIVLSALQEHEVVLCSSHSCSERSDTLSQSNIIPTSNLNDETDPALVPDVKIRCMTESNVKLFERHFQSAGTSARLSERIRKRPGG